jgi:hypothetical protein
MSQAADAVEEARRDLPREIAEIRLALAALSGTPAHAEPSLGAEVAAAIVERFRETYSRLDVDELFAAVRTLSHDFVSLAIVGEIVWRSGWSRTARTSSGRCTSSGSASMPTEPTS